MDVVELVRRYTAPLPPPVRKLVFSGLVAFSITPVGLIVGIVINLSNRLHGPHPLTEAKVSSFTAEELDSVSYADVDMLNAIPREPTHAGYAVVGGSGFVGSYIVRLLILRGETNIRILDLVPPPPDLAEHPSVTYTWMDVTSPASVSAFLSAPFLSTGAPPSVIFHTAAIIRFWERASYAWETTARVNVAGTRNVVDAAKALPTGTVLVYTSTSDIVIPRPRFMQLGKDYASPPWNTTVISDADAPLVPDAVSTGCYARSKVQAEQLVLAANGVDGLRTGSVRPGQTITGPNDNFYSGTLTMERVPVFDRRWSHTNVCVWDAAAAHLALEDALRREPGAVGGEAFLVTGNGPAWGMQEAREALNVSSRFASQPRVHYSSRPLVFDEVQPLFIFVLAHLVEAFLFLRYYFLLPFFAVVGSRPRLTPSWMGDMIFLQPATLDYMRDVVIDDSRARKMIGYRPQWQTAQVMKYTVDQIESGKVPARHGVKR
ncbi:NAD(P)-binding protein [Artomyces pyxidatus]|uniref:NAD(P)-binding protein n=1 Tax=Artomyces pyxidatus TaxID=48021 RepID=A0ACB8SNH2_9AGAM|nr:NAD(P)-binding protein [Artomyces pyxidatus]